MGSTGKGSQILGAVGVVVAIAAGATLPVVLSAAAPASSLTVHRAPVAACSPPAISGSTPPVADASPPCNPTMTVRPRSGLKDGQSVVVTGSGFPAESFFPLLECRSGAVSGSQCATGEGGYAGTGPTGAFQTIDQVGRLLSTSSGTIDCAQHQACVIAALDEFDGTVEAAAPITFENLPLPALSVSPTTALSDGQNVTVTGTNFSAGAAVQVTECPVAEVEVYQCDPDLTALATAGTSGGFSLTYNVARLLTTYQTFNGSSIDCAVAPGCELAAFGTFNQELVLPTPLTFNPAVPALPPLDVTLSLKPTGRIDADGAVELSGTITCTAKQPVTVNTQVDLSQVVDSLEATSALATQQTCTKAPSAVAVTMPEQTVPFASGAAQVTLDISARDGSSVTQQTVSGGVTLTVPAHQAPPVYYVALGDSAAAGYASPTGQGYAGDILTHLQATVPDLQLVDLGCSGETSTSMIEGGSGCSYESGSLTSQLAAATSFLAAHRGSVALITIDIGGNDYISCLDPSPPSYNPQCITATDGTVTTNLTTIMAQIRAAAGPTVPIVGMNYFDPFLDYWPLGTLGQSVAKESVPVVAGVNATLGAVYSGDSAPVADVASAFEITDFAHKVKTPEGRVPVAVANSCSWLDFTCAKGQGGYGTDTDAAGSAVIAGAFEKVLPSI